MGKKRPKEATPAAAPAQRGWVLLVGICFASTLGLAAAMLPVLEMHLESPWPWEHTQRFLLLAFPATVLLAVLYLSRQQRRSTAMHRALLSQREAAADRALRQSARLTAMLDLSRIMGSEVRLQGVFDAVTSICREAFESDQVSLMLVDRDAGELVVRAASGHADKDILGRRQKIGEGVAGHVAANSRAIVLGPGAVDPARFQSVQEPAQPLQAALVAPVLVRGEMVGVLNVASHAAGAVYDDLDLQALRVFAENVGSCIRHAEQAEWMRQLIQRHTGSALAEPAPVDVAPR